MASSPAQAEEAKLIPMMNNPGILPFKLGTSKIRQSDHVFLHSIDLNSFRENIKVVENQILTLESLVYDLNSDYKFRFTTLHEYVRDKFNSIIDSYDSLSKIRYKRALIDGLGTIIRSITGNLDQNDAVRYNKALETLQKNQDEITHHTNQAITLNRLFLENYNNTISAIARNQDKINAKISEIIRQINISEYDFYGFVKLDSSYKLLEINLNIIFDTLITIETAVSLSTKHIVYRSLISFSNLQYFINVLKKHYNSDQLLTSDITESRIYYSFLDIGSYFSDNKLVFVIKIPIYFRDSFTYYQLFPIPTPNNTVLIPEKSHLVMNENAYQYTETDCNQIGTTYYCQEDSVLYNSMYSPDCIHTLIMSQKLLTSCQYHQVKIVREIFEKINEGYYIINSPNSIKLHIRCLQDEYLMINGSYLLRLPENCSASTDTVTFTNLHDNINGKPVKLFSFGANEMKISNPLEPLKIENVKLNQLHNTVGLIEREQQLINLENYHFQPQLYLTTPLYIILFLVILYIAYRKLKGRKETNNGTTPELTAPEQAQGQAPHRSFFRT